MTGIAPAFCLALLICACQTPSQGGSTDGAARPDDLVLGRLVRVSDGDSGVVVADDSEIEVRFMGINAPEQGECFFQEASDHLAGLVEGRTIGLEVIDTDQFDRALAYVWLDGLLVNEDLVEGGSALATTPGEGDPHGGRLLAAEEAAYLAGAGLWSERACGSPGPGSDITIDVATSRFDPPGPDEERLDQEWVALASREMVDLGGWTIRDESSQHRCTLPSGMTVTTGSGLAVTSADPCWDPGGSPVWNNGGDLVLLLDMAGAVVARHRYQR